MLLFCVCLRMFCSNAYASGKNFQKNFQNNKKPIDMLVRQWYYTTNLVGKYNKQRVK